MLALLTLLATILSPNPPPPVSYACDGSTAIFIVNFPYDKYTDLVVTSTTPGGAVTTLAYTTDYTVSVTSSTTTASLTLNAPASSCPNTNILKINRTTQRTQPTNFAAQTTYNPALHTKVADRLEMQIQELSSLALGSTISFGPGQLFADSPIIGDGSSGNHLRWNFAVPNTWTATQTFAPSGVGTGVIATGFGAFPGVQATGGTNNPAIIGTGVGSGPGLQATGGASGTALTLKPQAGGKTAAIDMYSSGGSVLWSMGKQTDDTFVMHDTANVNDFLTVSSGNVLLEGSSVNIAGNVTAQGGTAVSRIGNGGSAALLGGFGGSFIGAGSVGNGGGASLAGGAGGNCTGGGCDAPYAGGSGGDVALLGGQHDSGSTGTDGKVLLKTYPGPTTQVTIDSAATAIVTVNGTFKTVSAKNRGTCTLNGASPAVCTATVLSGAICGCFVTGTTAAAALHTVATSVTTTTLTCTGANGLVDVVNYLCN